jgi:superfamily I DNA/RNA helicase
MPEYHFSMTKDVYKLLSRTKGGLGAVERKAFDQTLELMARNPFDPAVNRGGIVTARDPNVYHSEVGSLRLIWRLVDGQEVILAYLGEHDPANNWARRHRIELHDGLVRLTDVLNLPAPVQQEKGLWARFVGSRDNIFWHCSDDELVALGVEKELIPALRSMRELRALRSIEETVPQNVFDALYQKALEVVKLPPAPTETQIRTSLERFGGGEELVRFVNSEEFRCALEGSMEDWMLFLAPRQRRLVYTNYNGPARVKGIAGSGKTVVAIHRARVMAQRNIKDRDRERILFLTYGNRLPDVNKRLLERLTNNGPEVAVIECRSIHSWVGSLLQNQNVHMKVGGQEQLDTYLQHAINEVRPKYPEQETLWEQPLSFFRDEIRYRIKGRDALRREEIYLHLPRTGRGTPLRENARRAMFAVALAYQERLQEAKVNDWEDLILAALDRVDPARHNYTYVGAVVDEIQDLTEATLKLIRKMVAPGTDDLFLAGDGTQRIYKGGFSLNQIGIQVKGRETVLRFNYRNTRQIMRLASAIMQGVKIDDMDDEEAIDVPEPEEAVRSGEEPVLRLFSANSPGQPRTPGIELEEIKDIAREIRDLKAKHSYDDKDFAILFRNRKPYVELVQNHLGCPTVVLDKDGDNADGNMADKLFGPGVKLSTLHSAKGLEFKAVFIVGASDDLLPYFHQGENNMPPEERSAHVEQERRLLYVAVTRARDLLYITCPRTKKVTRFLRSISDEVLCRLEG